MDSPLVNRIFRRLFAHETCSTLRFSRQRPRCVGAAAQYTHANGQRRTILGLPPPEKKSTRYSKKIDAGDEVWEQRAVLWQYDKTKDFEEAPLVTAEELAKRRQRPTNVKMLMRDFIDDSLYNPHYGYFPKEAVIFSPGTPFDFNQMRDEPEFHAELGRRYTTFEDALDERKENDARQLWHTPTELFRPYYGEAIARYMVANYKLGLYPYYDLLIYEMGAGNGTLMANILDYIAREHPEVYERTRYRIIEISGQLANQQQEKLRRMAAHAGKVEIINKSVFEWDTYVASPCFFLALEVFDNFSHDCIKYDVRRGTPKQGYVLIDRKGDFYDFYVDQLDPIATRYLSIRDIASSEPYMHPLRPPLMGSFRGNVGHLTRRIVSYFKEEQLSQPEYIPTRLMQFFDILHNYFPAHKLVSADFDRLGDTVPGVNAPVVQTRYKRAIIPVRTPMVYQGFFDIFFPTDFALQSSIYRAITGKFTTQMSHGEFLRRWSEPEETMTMSGENPLFSWYQNASFMMTV